MKTLSPSDADLHEVEMSVRRKQMRPFMTELLSDESKADAAKLAMFQSLVTMLEMYVFEDPHAPINAQQKQAARMMCIEASKLVLL